MVEEYPKERKKGTQAGLIAIGVGSAALIGLAIYGLTRGKTQEPEPPEEGRANIWGTVYDAFTQTPLAGVMVTIASIVVYTDEQGYYLHANIMPGQYTIRFELEGYETLTVTKAIVEGNNEVNVDMIPLATKAELHIGVWDSETQAAVFNALVKIQGPQTQQLYTDQWGDASFYDIPAGNYTVTITHTNYETFQATIEVPPGRTEKEFLVVAKTPGGDMSGIDCHWVVCSASAFTGTPFDVRAQCENVSGQEDDFTIVCKINGLTFTQPAHIAYPGWKEVIITCVVNTPGNYNVCVGGACAPIVVQEKVEGQFCCPLCGQGPFADTEELAHHLMYDCPEDLESWGSNPSPCYRLHVTCPICDDEFEVYYCKEWGARYKTVIPAFLNHVKSAHGIQALYCENIPEGGYRHGCVKVTGSIYNATVKLVGPRTYQVDHVHYSSVTFGYVLVGTYTLYVIGSSGTITKTVTVTVGPCVEVEV